MTRPVFFLPPEAEDLVPVTPIVVSYEVDNVLFLAASAGELVNDGLVFDDEPETDEPWPGE